LIAAALVIGGLVIAAGPWSWAAALPPTLPIPLTQYLNANCTAPPNYAFLTRTSCTDTAGGASNLGGESFVSTSMPSAGKLTIRGVDFIWPGQTYQAQPLDGGVLQLDTILDGTTPIDLGGQKGYKGVALLAAGFTGDQLAAPYKITYADGSTQTTPLWLRDWGSPQRESDVPGVRIQEGSDNANLSAGNGAIHMLVIPVDPKRGLRSLTLPGGSVHTLTYAVSLTNVDPIGGGPLDGPRYTPNTLEGKYEQPGPWGVTVSTTTVACDRKGDVCTIYAPTPLGVDPRTGKPYVHALLSWANGSGVNTVAYDYYIRHLATWGFVVVATADTSTGDGTTVTDAANYMIAQSKTPGSPYYGKIDANHVGAVGHSQGGGAAAVLFAHQTPPFSAYVAIHVSPSWFCYVSCGYKPGDMANATHGAILFLGSIANGQTDETFGFYNDIPDAATKAEGILQNADHNDVSGNPHCVPGGAGCVTGAYGYLGYSTLWFEWQLKGDTTEGLAAFNGTSGEFVQADDDWTLNRTNVKG
jgi:hypothetical protein